MQKSGRSVAVNTRELRMMARDAHHRGLNKQMTPTQFKLLDPRGVHIITPEFMHDHADTKRVEAHMRCFCFLKLIGKDKAVERMLDIPMHFLRDIMSDEEIAQAEERGRNFRAFEHQYDEELTDSVTDALEGNVEGKA